MKKFILRFSNLMDPTLSNWLRWLLLLFRSRHVASAFKTFVLSDQVNKYQHILEAVNYARVAGSGGRLPQTYFEFGCHSARTFSAALNAARFLKVDEFEAHAFDSFEGLPPTTARDGIFREGTFFTSEIDFLRIVKCRTGITLSQRFVHSGFYSKSLTTELQSELPKVGVLHVDVDLYSSTVEIFEFIEPLLCDGTVILFDDWYCFPKASEGGEALAVREFLERNPEIEFSPWKAYSTFGQSFFVKRSC